jgi:hypothetical protein
MFRVRLRYRGHYYYITKDFFSQQYEKTLKDNILKEFLTHLDTPFDTPIYAKIPQNTPK